MVRKADENWCLAEVIQKRPGDDGKHFEYYVHYENYNRYASMSVYFLPPPPKKKNMSNWQVGEKYDFGKRGGAKISWAKQYKNYRLNLQKKRKKLFD